MKLKFINPLLCILIMWIGGFSQTVNDIYDGGVEKMNKKLYDEAIKDFSSVILKDSYYFNAYHDRAMCYAAQNKMYLAIADLESAIATKKAYENALHIREEQTNHHKYILQFPIHKSFQNS